MSELFEEWRRHQVFRLATVVLLLIFSCALLVLLVATTGYRYSVQRTVGDVTLIHARTEGGARPRSKIHLAANATENSVAIMPFENLSTDANGFLFASSIQNQVLEALSRFTEINVIGGAADAGARDTARRQGAQTLLTGKVRYDSGKLNVEVELSDASTLGSIWRLVLTGEALDMFGFEAQIVGGITYSLGVPLSDETREQMARLPTQSQEAYVAFAMAKALIMEGIEGASAAGNRLEIQNLLDEALEFDPNFAMAYAWKALVYTRSKDADAASEEARANRDRLLDQLAQRSAAKALELDAALGLPHAVLARVHTDNGRRDEAEREADIALELSPHYPEVLSLYALVETEVRQRPAEAIPYLERAIALSPNDPALYAQLGRDMAITGRAEDAEAAFARCRVINPAATFCAVG